MRSTHEVPQTENYFWKQLLINKRWFFVCVGREENSGSSRLHECRGRLECTNGNQLHSFVGNFEILSEIALQFASQFGSLFSFVSGILRPIGVWCNVAFRTCVHPWRDCRDSFGKK